MLGLALGVMLSFVLEVVATLVVPVRELGFVAVAFAVMQTLDLVPRAVLDPDRDKRRIIWVVGRAAHHLEQHAVVISWVVTVEHPLAVEFESAGIRAKIVTQPDDGCDRGRLPEDHGDQSDHKHAQHDRAASGEVLAELVVVIADMQPDRRDENEADKRMDRHRQQVKGEEEPHHASDREGRKQHRDQCRDPVPLHHASA